MEGTGRGFEWFREIGRLVSAIYLRRGGRSGLAHVFAAPANVIAVAVVEACASAPLALRLAVVVAFDRAMMVPVVARSANDCERNQPHRDTGKKTSTMARFGAFKRSRDEACGKDRYQTRPQNTRHHERWLARKLGKLLAWMLGLRTWERTWELWLVEPSGWWSRAGSNR